MADRYRYLELFRNFLKEHDAYEDWIREVEASRRRTRNVSSIPPHSYISGTFTWTFSGADTKWSALHDYWTSVLDNELSNGR